MDGSSALKRLRALKLNLYKNINATSLMGAKGADQHEASCVYPQNMTNYANGGN